MRTPPPFTTVRTDAELCAMWQGLMGPGGFTGRSIWLTFFDVDDRVQPVLMPIDDIPAEPVPSLLHNLARVVADLIDTGAAATVAVLLSRDGPAAMTDTDRRWARALLAAFGPGLARRPVHLATRGRIQVFAPDDLIAA